MTTTYEDYQDEWDRRMAKAMAEVSPRWSITGYKGHQTHDGVAWVARLRLDGKPVAYLEDAGQGGSVMVQFWGKDGVDRESSALWKAECERIFPGDVMGDEMLIEALLQKAGK